MSKMTDNQERTRADGGPTTTPAATAEPAVVAPDELEAADDTPGIARKVAFQTEAAVLVQSRVAGGTESGWHHHGDRHVFGYLIDGRATLEYGPDRERFEGAAPAFFHVPPGVVHRDLNPSDEEQLVVATFVGAGPLVVNVDGPDAE